MSIDTIVLLLVVVPFVVFFVWLRSAAESLSRETWERVFRSWRRAWAGGSSRHENHKRRHPGAKKSN